MRNINSIGSLCAILTLPSSSWSFSPPSSQWGITNTAKSSAAVTSLMASKNTNDDSALDMDRVKTGAVTFLTASVLALNGMAGPLSVVQPAYAAPSTTTAVDPLASEKASVLAVKTSIESSSAELSALKRVEAAEKKAYEKAVADDQASEKRVKAAKAALIESNDKVIKEKAKGSTDESSLRTQQKLGEKVGAARTTLKAEEAYLSNAKKVVATDKKSLDAVESKVASASKKVSSAKSGLPKAEKKLKVAEKKLAKTTKAAKKKAEKLAKEQAKKEKIAKKKAAIAEKKRNKEAAEKAKKKKAEIAAVKEKVKQLKSVEKSSSSELIKQEKLLQKISA